LALPWVLLAHHVHLTTILGIQLRSREAPSKIENPDSFLLS